MINPLPIDAQNDSYNRPQEITGSMGRPKQPSREETFGRRLARLRKEAGYSQRSLAEEIGISNRMVAYYEAQTEHPPAHLLTPIADALSLTVDQLLGRAPISKRKAPQNERLIRQLRQVEKLPARARQSVLEHIEGLVAKYGGR
jgi:transcriptional regulator with XRE-family HTH domain